MGLCGSKSDVVDPKNAPTQAPSGNSGKVTSPKAAPANGAQPVTSGVINPSPQLGAGSSSGINPGPRGGSAVNLRLQLSNAVHTGSGTNLAGLVASPGTIPLGSPIGMSRRVSSLTAIDPRSLKELPAAALIAAALNDAAYFSNILTAIARKSGVLTVPVSDAQRAGLLPLPTTGATTGAGAIVAASSSAPATNVGTGSASLLKSAFAPPTGTHGTSTSGTSGGGSHPPLKQLSEFHRLVEQLAFAREDKLCHGEDVIEVAASAGSAEVLDVLLTIAPQLIHHKKADTGNSLLHFAALGPIHVVSLYDNLRVHLQHDTEVMSVLNAAGVAVGGTGNNGGGGGSPATPGGGVPRSGSIGGGPPLMVSASAPTTMVSQGAGGNKPLLATGAGAGSVTGGSSIGLDIDAPTNPPANPNPVASGASASGAVPSSRPTSLRITAPGPASISAPCAPGGSVGMATPGSTGKKRSTGVQYMQQLLQLHLQQQGLIPKQPQGPAPSPSIGTPTATGAAASTAPVTVSAGAAVPAGGDGDTGNGNAQAGNTTGGMKRSASFFNDHAADGAATGVSQAAASSSTAASSTTTVTTQAAASTTGTAQPGTRASTTANGSSNNNNNNDDDGGGMIRLPPRNALVGGASFFGTGLGLDGHHEYTPPTATQAAAPSSSTAGAGGATGAASGTGSTTAGAPAPLRSSPPTLPSSAASAFTVTTGEPSRSNSPESVNSTGSALSTASATSTGNSAGGTGEAPASSSSSTSASASTGTNPPSSKRPPSHPAPVPHALPSGLPAGGPVVDSDGLSSHDLVATAAHNRLRLSITGNASGGGVHGVGGSHHPNPFAPLSRHHSASHGPSSLSQPSSLALSSSTALAPIAETPSTGTGTRAPQATVAVVAAPQVLSLSDLTHRFPPRSIERTVRVLLKHGAQTDAKNLFGKIPRDAALSQARQISLAHHSSGSMSALVQNGSAAGGTIAIGGTGMGSFSGSSSNIIGVTSSAQGSSSSLAAVIAAAQAQHATSAVGGASTGTITFSPSALSSGGSSANLSGLSTSACVASAACGLLAEGSMFDRLLRTIPVDWDTVAELLKPAPAPVSAASQAGTSGAGGSGAKSTGAVGATVSPGVHPATAKA